jgi:uncharacterized phage-associated protein
MANVIDVANFFVDVAAKTAEVDRGDYMTNLRLQKLLFFAQGWHLARRSAPLFTAPFEAWTFGPVVREVYDMFKQYRRRSIVEPSEDHSENRLSIEEREFAMDILIHYETRPTTYLVNLTHKMEPWLAREKRREIIPIEEIKTYFENSGERFETLEEIVARLPADEGRLLPDGTRVYSND